MQIFGIGIDVVETERIRQAIDRQGESFIQRIFTDQEVLYCRSSKFPEQQFGARFAAKEAVSKAFGTGIGNVVGWKDIEVCRRESGEPHIVLCGAAEAYAKEKGVCQVMISLTHTKHYAAANAVVMCD